MIEIGNAQSIAHLRVHGYDPQSDNAKHHAHGVQSSYIDAVSRSPDELSATLRSGFHRAQRRISVNHDLATRLISRRTVLLSLAATGAYALVPSRLFAAGSWQPKAGDEAFLDDLERQGCLFFWEQASPTTGQVLDRARNDLNGARDPRRMASIAATGFGLSALCIAHKRGYLPKAQIEERVRTTLDWHLNKFPEVHGFLYHFTDVETGARFRRSEVSSIDTSILLCGALTAKGYFGDPQISRLAQ